MHDTFYVFCSIIVRYQDCLYQSYQLCYMTVFMYMVDMFIVCRVWLGAECIFYWSRWSECLVLSPMVVRARWASFQTFVEYWIP